MITYSHRRRLAALEVNNNSEADEFSERFLAWSIRMLFDLDDQEPQRPRESRDAYEARTLLLTTRQWKAMCKAAGPDSDCVKIRDDLRKLAKAKDRDHEKEILTEMSERLSREIEAG